MTWWEQVYNAVAHVVPSALGAFGSYFFTRGGTARKLALIPLAGVCAYYAGGYISSLTGMPETLSGFVMGVCSMPVIDKFVQEVNEVKFIQPLLEAVITRIRGK